MAMTGRAPTATLTRGIGTRLESPTGLAVALALLSIVPVAVSLAVPPSPNISLAVPFQDALLVSAGTVLLTAVIGGWLGGRAAGRHRLLGVAVALGVSWPVGMALLPMVAWTLGIDLRLGQFCFDGCPGTFYWIDSRGPLVGIGAYLAGLFFGVVTMVAVLGAGIAALLAAAAARFRHRSVAAAAIVVAYGSLNLLSLLFGGAVPYACLGLGVMAWSASLARRAKPTGPFVAPVEPGPMAR
jgi:hypothetical protein